MKVIVTVKETPASSPPLYCGVDGMTLVDKRTALRVGFDPFTGIERPRREHVTRECQNQGHTVWVLSDDGSKWIKA